jgi:hypothetical protein
MDNAMIMHKDQASGRWSQLSLTEQMGNIGTEVNRMINWKHKDKALANKAFERMLELINLTLSDMNNFYRLRELARAKEMLIKNWLEPDSGSDKELDRFNDYFYRFAWAARIQRPK